MANRTRFILLFAVAALIVQRPAHALVEVLGEGMGKKCYEAAYAVSKGRLYVSTLINGVTLATPFDLCTMALDETMNKHDRAGTYVNRGVLMFEDARYDIALKDFDEAIRADDSLGEGHANRGAALIGLRRWQEGAAAITRGIELGAGEMEKSYYNRALANEALGNAKGAYYDYKKAAELAPDWQLPSDELKRFSIKRSD